MKGVFYKMRVLFATSEAYPYAASGGLGDVAFALPKALKKKNVSCKVVMPLYSSIKQELRDQMQYITSVSNIAVFLKQNMMA